MIFLLGIFILLKNTNTEYKLPDGQTTKEETIFVNENNMKIEKKIMITDGIKHSVPLDEIVGGGPGKDGIPSIDNPKFISINRANEFLNNKDPGIMIDLDDAQRFYPFQILVWHEIVNDNINGKQILISYCPLCFSGIVFDPVVKGERVEFGTSGKLWNSNLVMYDRKTDSLWSQILGESILGEMTGVKLKIIPSEQLRYENFKSLHPNGMVLSKDTGAARLYGKDPYGDYYSNSDIYFPVNKNSDRLDPKAFVLGIVIDGKSKAYWTDAIKRENIIEDVFAETAIVAKYNQNTDTANIYKKNEDESLEKINPIPNFWFAWVAVHPDTELYK